MKINDECSLAMSSLVMLTECFRSSPCQEIYFGITGAQTALETCGPVSSQAIPTQKQVSSKC